MSNPWYIELTPERLERLHNAADGGWTRDGRAQPLGADLRALLQAFDRLNKQQRPTYPNELGGPW